MLTAQTYRPRLTKNVECWIRVLVSKGARILARSVRYPPATAVRRSRTTASLDGQSTTSNIAIRAQHCVGLHPDSPRAPHRSAAEAESVVQAQLVSFQQTVDYPRVNRIPLTPFTDP